MKRSLMYAVFWMGIGLPIWGQSTHLSNVRILRIATADTIYLPEAGRIVPGSVQVNVLDSSFEVQGDRLLLSPILEQDSLTVTYRIFPFLARQHRDTTMMFRENDGAWYMRPERTAEKMAYGTLFDYQGVDYTGSYTRGISFGNRQNLVVNSNLNLQMNGLIGDDLAIQAAISDNNVPIQPEGNTQQLQDFDRIYIQLSRKRYSLIAGDYEIQRPYGYFTRYYKKLQGLTLTHRHPLPDSSHVHSTASIAVSRGKFARNNLQPQEGNQGPYRLSGNNGERFLIVLAGTEKVFWDGQLLRRGLEYDYVIDYNQATIAFTANRLVTKDIRIIVEFEYTTQQYLRSLIAVNSEYHKGAWTVYGNVYSEQDGKNSGEARNFTAEQRTNLRDAGDSDSGVLGSGERPATEESGPVRYIKIANPTSCAEPDSIYVLTDANRLQGAYIVGFTEVGAGNGHYVRLPAQAFGTAYAYSPPDAQCSATGNYAPLIRLVSPVQLQLHTAGAQYAPHKNSQIGLEVGLSNVDNNRYSALDDDDNTGTAFRMSGSHAWTFASEKTNSRLQIDGDYEQLSHHFQALNPFRQPEFARDWNVPLRHLQRRPEQLFNAGLTFQLLDSASVRYGLQFFNRDSVYKGIRHLANWQYHWGRWELLLNGSFLRSRTPNERSHFDRPNALVARSWKGLRVGLYGEQENNRRYVGPSDSLHQQSFRYDLWRAFAESSHHEYLRWRLAYEQRQDFLPIEGMLFRVNRASNWLFSGSWQWPSQQQLEWKLAIRTLTVQDTVRSPQSAMNTLLGRLTYRFTAWKGLLRSSTIYEIGSGQEQRIEFVYVEVRPGDEGTHYWIDRNEDGLIQFEEVELPPFPEAANVRRITQFTGDFVRADKVQLIQTLYIEPRFVARKNKGWETFLKKWSGQLNISLTRKTRDLPGVQAWNPLQFDLPDLALVSVGMTAQTGLFFNRADPVYEVQLNRIENRNRILLSTGYEGRMQYENTLRFRWNFTKTFSTILRILEGGKYSDSEFFDTRDFDIDYWAVEPQLVWQPTIRFRTTFTWGLRQSQDQLSGDHAVQKQLEWEANYNQNEATTLRGQLSYVRIRYEGQSNTPVGFALLEGLQNGNNLLWNFGIDKRITGNIRLSIGYEGRKTGDAPLVHIGRAQVQALF